MTRRRALFGGGGAPPGGAGAGRLTGLIVHVPTPRRFVSLLLGGMLGMMSGRAAGAEPASRIVLTVIDDASSSIPGALATLSSDQLVGGARQGTTYANGVAEFSSLLPGSYRLLVQKQGFGPVTRTDIPVQYMRTSSVAIRMKPGDGFHPPPSHAPNQVVLAHVCDFVAQECGYFTRRKLLRQCSWQDDPRLEQAADKR